MKLLFVIAVAAILMPALAAMAEDSGAAAAPPQPVATNQAPDQAPAVTAAAKAPKKELELQDLILTGKITREEGLGKNGMPVTHYFLTDASGNRIALPTPHAKKKGAVEPAVITLDDYVDAYVTLTARGTRTDAAGRKGAKTTIDVRTITAIEKGRQP